jgi:hypothetical protein
MTPLSVSALRHWKRPRFKSRAVALAIAILFELLFILALLIPFGEPRPKRLSPTTTVFSLPAGQESAEKAEQPKKAEAPVVAKRPDPAVKKPIVDTTPPQPKPTPNMVPMTSEDFAATDIGKLPRASAGAAGSKGAYGPGDGPGGKTLYPADWYRKPRNGALAEYLPYGAPNGAWAMIACRTVENYHVDNCVGMGESHVGLAQALRKASWEFLVLPPRINGRPQIGAWVRIRFDFTERTDE